MPFTPFHFGPALLIGLLCLRWLDLPTLLVASVAVDLRATAVFFGLLDGTLHGPLHTVLGATALAGVLTAAALPLRPSFDALLDRIGITQSASWKRISTAALVGCWSHVFLDATLYTDLRPFAPVSTANPAFGTVGSLIVYGGCAVAGLLGLWLYVASMYEVVTLTGVGPT